MSISIYFQTLCERDQASTVGDLNDNLLCDDDLYDDNHTETVHIDDASDVAGDQLSNVDDHDIDSEQQNYHIGFSSSCSQGEKIFFSSILLSN